MADERWFTQLESRIFTIVTARMKKALPKYKLKCTTDGQSDGPSYFPTVYMHELSPYETGMDLTNQTINALVYTMQIEVFAKDKKDAKAIMSEAVLQMKKLSFDVTTFPVEMSDGNVVQSVARFRRVIGAGDTDIVV